MEFNSNKQKLLIEYLLSSPDTFALCKSILQPDYFNPEFRQTVEFVDLYYEQYSRIPPFRIIKAEFDLEFEKLTITRDEIEFCTKEIEKFCQYKAAETAVIKASKLLKEGKHDEIEALVKEAAAVSLNADLGSNYFTNVESRLDRMSKEPQRISTGWKDVDRLLGGGLARTELLLMAANSGGGKSITLANLALNMVKAKYNVLYISLELSQDLVQQRFDTMVSGIPTVIWQNNIDNIVDAVHKLGSDAGELYVIRMPGGTNSNKIRGVLKEFELKKGYIPDLIVCDYLDIMGTNKATPTNVSEKDKQATEEFRDILEDYKCMGATASQLNRAAIEAEELNQSHTAGGLTKVNTVDWYFAIILTPAMKAKGIIMLDCLKSRSSDAVGKKASLDWNNVSLIISDSKSQEDEYTQQLIDYSEQTNKPKQKQLNLLDVIDI